MIRKLTQADHENVMTLVSKKPAENLFIIGDIEIYGYDNDIQELWGEFEGSSLNAIMLRFGTNFIPYAEGAFDALGFANLFLQHEKGIELSGLKHIVDQLAAYIPYERIRHIDTYYAECKTLLIEESTEHIEPLQPKDYAENVEMLRSIPEFLHSDAFTVESKEREVRDGLGRTYVMFEDDVMVSSASSSAENSMSAMIVGVGTRPGYEKRGYATKVVYQLTKDLIEEGKSVCLFYSNEKAGRIYKRIGFEDIGMWTIYKFKR
ncbi:GNAT family N-acetyltransferase [Macrococcus sp. DPC7161]|uniref:GNAT family N-acetyltransferase n=1 Tax=Macrococcus sp. DPC7161 TaxID=2507060 RepID=UPI00100B3BFA|nr:GNAT family N-acetyltransferase [Macrococcus sp. DPC7161]RXK17909.1 GNAT family N-acetyltransferase [Macrococcus sp. DPC7161]